MAVGSSGRSETASDALRHRRSRFLRIVPKRSWLYLIMLPVLAWCLIFRYLPMYGIVFPFQGFKFSPVKPLM